MKRIINPLSVESAVASAKKSLQSRNPEAKREVDEVRRSLTREQRVLNGEVYSAQFSALTEGARAEIAILVDAALEQEDFSQGLRVTVNNIPLLQPRVHQGAAVRLPSGVRRPLVISGQLPDSDLSYRTLSSADSLKVECNWDGQRTLWAFGSPSPS